MIPQISQAPGVVQLVLNFLQALEQQGFTGDTATSYADRLTMATDNSIYQLLPDAVVFPVPRLMSPYCALAAEERFQSLVFTPRGGGTGTNGQALNQGIIVDMSRYMNRIIEINPEEGWVRVEAGSSKISSTSILNRTAIFCAGAVHQQPRHAWRDDQHRCFRAGLAGLRKTSDHVLGVRPC
jgi:hypothetical protein